MVDTYKSSSLVDLKTLRCLSKYLFRERERNDILERDTQKICM